MRIPAGPETGERVFWVTTRLASQAAEGGFLAAAREVTGQPGEKLRADSADTVAEPADALTGFANREQFHFELEREIAARGPLRTAALASSSSGSTTSRR